MRKAAILAMALMFAAAVQPSTAMADGCECVADECGCWCCGEPEQTINAYDGIYWYGDRLETYYSSAVAYHWRTPEWWVDELGFYRTDEGYYVVAASDYEEGEVIECSMGLAQVLDCGPDCGVTDYYVDGSWAL